MTPKGVMLCVSSAHALVEFVVAGVGDAVGNGGVGDGDGRLAGQRDSGGPDDAPPAKAAAAQVSGGGAWARRRRIAPSHSSKGAPT